MKGPLFLAIKTYVKLKMKEMKEMKDVRKSMRKKEKIWDCISVA